jgi:FtsH-binding integral membrane protein
MLVIKFFKDQWLFVKQKKISFILAVIVLAELVFIGIIFVQTNKIKNLSEQISASNARIEGNYWQLSREISILQSNLMRMQIQYYRQP